MQISFYNSSSKDQNKEDQSEDSLNLEEKNEIIQSINFKFQEKSEKIEIEKPPIKEIVEKEENETQILESLIINSDLNQNPDPKQAI